MLMTTPCEAAGAIALHRAPQSEGDEQDKERGKIEESTDANRNVQIGAVLNPVAEQRLALPLKWVLSWQKRLKQRKKNPGHRKRRRTNHSIPPGPR